MTLQASVTASRLLIAAAILLAIGCGKKGPPLAPIVRIPEAVTKISVQRVGSEAYVTLTVPDKNVDTSMPVDIGRVEVYGYTGRAAPPRTKWVELGELVATIPIVRPPPQSDAANPETTNPNVAAEGALPGAAVTVLDELTSEKLVQGPVDNSPVPRNERNLPVRPVAEQEPQILRRYYVAFAFSARGRPGPPGTAANFPMVELPTPPAFVRAPYSDSAIALEWPPSGGLVGYLFDHSLSPEDSPVDDLSPESGAQPSGGPSADGMAAPPGGPVHYNLYRELAPDPLAFPDAAAAKPWAAARPTPLNATPLDAMTYADPVEFGRRRCYSVRAVRGTAPNIVEGDPSEPACLTPTDIFPPAAPTHLVAIADEGGISLIWEPNGEPDLAGYVVLRGETSDATLQPLASAPIAEPRFRDTHVTAGKRYVYTVVAVDATLPAPNVSAESNHVEETAR